jgi:hypothetical protein
MNHFSAGSGGGVIHQMIFSLCCYGGKWNKLVETKWRGGVGRFFHEAQQKGWNKNFQSRLS